MSFVSLRLELYIVCKSRDYPCVSSTMGTGGQRKLQSEKAGDSEGIEGKLGKVTNLHFNCIPFTNSKFLCLIFFLGGKGANNLFLGHSKD